MFRITTHDEPDCLTFRLEGRLAGTWVQEMDDCWRRAVANHPKTNVRLDLTGLTYIDQAGKSLLAKLHAQGAEFVACGCLMRAIVAELTDDPTNENRCPNLSMKVSPNGGAT